MAAAQRSPSRARAFVRLARPVDFGADDRQPVDLSPP